MEIKVPPLGESVTEATIARWLKKVGDTVQVDELLVEIETDKVTLEVTAPGSGILSHVEAVDGSTVRAGQVIGQLQDEKKTSKKSPKVETKQSTPEVSSEKQMIAQEMPGAERERRVKMSRLRQRIAQRLKEAQNTAACLTTFNEIDMSRVMAARESCKEEFEQKHGVKLGFMSFFTKASIAALRELPTVNAEIQGDEIVYKDYYNIGIAVGTDQGLMVPVLKDADQMTLAGIEKSLSALAQKAREGKIAPDDLAGGTFTITNGGIYGSMMSTPILNPPQSGILGLHRIQKRAVVIDDRIEIRPMMYVALTYDHRLIDGKEAVTFLVRVKEYMETPERLLLDRVFF